MRVEPGPGFRNLSLMQRAQQRVRCVLFRCRIAYHDVAEIRIQVTASRMLRALPRERSNGYVGEYLRSIPQASRGNKVDMMAAQGPDAIRATSQSGELPFRVCWNGQLPQPDPIEHIDASRVSHEHIAT
jgi:hypothetical protein